MDSKSVFSEVNGKSLQPPPPDLEIGYNKLWWTKKKEKKQKTNKKENKQTKDKFFRKNLHDVPSFE